MVVTQPDKYVGRKKVLTKSPVKLCAEAHNIQVDYLLRQCSCHPQPYDVQPAVRLNG